MMVEIPPVLIQRLHPLGPHFIRVNKHGKEPIDLGWPTNPLWDNDPDLIEWLKDGGNYGVVGGYGLIIVDTDHDELKQIVRESLPPTFTVQSPGSHGYHLYYLCGLEKPIRLRDKDGVNIGDIQGMGKMCVGPDCIHPNGKVYRIIDDGPLAQVTREQLVEVFKEYVVLDREVDRVAAKWEHSESGYDISILQVVPLTGLKHRGSEYFGPHPIHGSTTGTNFWINPANNCWHCFRHGSGGDPLSWIAVEEGVIACEEAVPGALRGEIFSQVLQKARERGLIKDVKKPRKRRNLKAEEARLVAEHEEKKPFRFVPFMELPDGRLVEQGFDGKDVYFLVYSPENDKVARIPELELEDFILKPIDNDEVRDRTVLLPSDTEEYESEEKLTEEIREFLNRWHEPPSPLSRTLDVFYTFLTYIKDLVPQLPYRRYLAPWGKGKSAWLETLGWICYRGIILAGSDTDKSVVRKMNNWRGTALIDEADFGDSSFYAFLIKILNIGYDRKTGFYHRSDDNDPNNILSYSVYAPKLLATRAKYKDLALESRCLTTIGRQNVNPIPLFRMAKFCDEALSLRNKLTLWRFRNYYRVKQTAAELEEPHIAEKVYDGANNISSRVKQVILPLWLIGGGSMKQTLTNLAETFDRRLKIEDPDYLLELQARDAVKEIAKALESENEETVNIRNMVNILFEAPQDPIYEMPLSLISKTILKNRGASEDEITVSDVTSVSKRLKGVFETNLGFNIRIGKKRRRVVQIPSRWVGQPEEAKSGGLEDFV